MWWKYAEMTELYIPWSELSWRKLSPTLAIAHYSCPDDAIGLVGSQLGGNFIITTNVCRSNVMPIAQSSQIEYWFKQKHREY